VSIRHLLPHVTPLVDGWDRIDGTTRARVVDSRYVRVDGTVSASRAVFAEGFDLYLDHGHRHGGWVYSLYTHSDAPSAQRATARAARRLLGRFGYRRNSFALDDG